MKKKLVSFMLMTTLLCTSTLSVSAETTETQDVGINETATCTVTADISSDYTVTIPKTIVLDSETKTAEYTVTVTGDISGTQTIKVTPDSTFVMSQEGRDDVTATVTQDITEWTIDNIDTVGTGTIIATDLTSGDWHGTYSFNIELVDTATVNP